MKAARLLAPLLVAVALIAGLRVMAARGHRPAVAAGDAAGAQSARGLARAASVSPVAPAPPAVASRRSAARHYLYVFVDQEMYVYDIDHGQRLVQQVTLPGVEGIRGVAASPRTHTLYVSYGSDGGPGTQGSLLAYDLLTGTIIWKHTYSRGVDSIAIGDAGLRLYVPDGELSTDGVWSVIDATSGAVIGQIDGAIGPHNTIVGLSDRNVYLGGIGSSHLDVASTATDRVIRQIGPLRPGVRPFTVNGAETLAFTTATGVLGFQVSSIRTGRLLYTLGFGPHFTFDPATFSPSAPSHGVTLSPDQRELWVIDAPNSYVHVFDVSRLPGRRPRRIADIRLAHPFTGQQSPCSYDCGRDGWLLHSRSGCFVYVGDSGDVISTVTRRSVAFLPALRNSREYLEIDWRGGVPVSTTSRAGLGYDRHGRVSRPPRCR